MIKGLNKLEMVFVEDMEQDDLFDILEDNNIEEVENAIEEDTVSNIEELNQLFPVSEESKELIQNVLG